MLLLLVIVWATIYDLFVYRICIGYAAYTYDHIILEASVFLLEGFPCSKNKDEKQSPIVRLIMINRSS